MRLITKIISITTFVLLLTSHTTYCAERGVEEKRLTLSDIQDEHLKTLSKRIKWYNVPEGSGFSPGECTIDWESATLSNNEHMLCYNMNINAEHKYMATVKGAKSAVPVVQKLIVFWGKNSVKNREKEVEYILTMVPSVKYYKKYGDSYGENYNHPGGVGKFDGYTIVLNPQRGLVISIIKYSNGKLEKIRHVLETRDMTEERRARMKEGNEMLKRITFELKE